MSTFKCLYEYLKEILLYFYIFVYFIIILFFVYKETLYYTETVLPTAVRNTNKDPRN